jgi:hypothetical protein
MTQKPAFPCEGRQPKQRDKQVSAQKCWHTSPSQVELLGQK